MKQYYVYQTCRTRPARIDVYKGFDLASVKVAVNDSQYELGASLLGSRWETKVQAREVTEWEELDINDFMR